MPKANFREHLSSLGFDHRGVRIPAAPRKLKREARREENGAQTTHL